VSPLDVTGGAARALTERLQAVAASTAAEVSKRLAQSQLAGNNDPMCTQRPASSTVVSGDTAPSGDVDKDIEELEAELEIARLQAKLLKLRKAKSREDSIRASTSTSPPPTPPSVKIKSASGSQTTSSTSDKSDTDDASLFPTDEEEQIGH